MGKLGSHHLFHHVVFVLVATGDPNTVRFLGIFYDSTASPVGKTLLRSDLGLRHSADGTRGDLIILTVCDPRRVNGAVECR